MEFLFMRHGRSLADDEGVYGGRYDDPLTPIGRQQAIQRAELLQAEHFTCDPIVASPLQRTAQTAEILGQALQIPVEFSADWMERDNGPLAGMTFEEGRKTYPIPEFKNRFEQFVPGQGGESEFDLHGRALRALSGLVARTTGNYLVVSHGGIFNAVMRCIVGAQPPVNQVYGVFFDFGDTGYLQVSYQPNRECWIFKKLIPGL